MSIRSFASPALGFSILMLPFCGCSKQPAKTNTEVKQAQAPTTAATPPESPMDDVVPPMLRTPWKGDLDEIVKRRVVRVLLPFRRPEFFYMDAHPVGILQEAFQELEKVLN